MAGDVAINGQTVPNRSPYSASTHVDTTVTLPVTRLALDNSRPLVVTRIRLFLGGRGAARNYQGYVAAANGSSHAGTGLRSVGASSAVDTGWMGLTAPLGGYGAEMKIGIDNVSGSINFGTTDLAGRNVYDDFGQYTGRTLSGWYSFIEAPTAPGINTLTATSSTSAQVNIAGPGSYGGAAAETWYVDYATTNFTGGYSTISSTSSFIDVTGLTPGVTYYFRSRLSNAATRLFSTTSPASASSSLTLGSAPDAPTGLAVMTGAGYSAATWSAPASNGGQPITSYRLDYSVDSAFGTYSSTTTAALKATVLKLTPGSVYNFRVSATNSIGTSPASSTVAATPPERTTLDVVASAAAHVSSGVQVEIRSDGAASPTLTLGYVAFGVGTDFVSIASLATGYSAGQFAPLGGALNVSLVTDPDGNVYVIGIDGANLNALLVTRYVRTGTTTWAASGKLSQAMPSAVDGIVGVAAAFVPGVGGSPTPSIFALARRAGSVSAVGSISYAVLSPSAVAASAGSLFLNYGNDPSFLGKAPTGAADNSGTAAVAALVDGGTRLAMVANGLAVVGVTNGVVSSVSKSADGTAITGAKLQVVGVSADMFTVIRPSSGALSATFYGSNGSTLGSVTYSGANAQGGSFAALWAAYYDRVAGLLTAYYVADDSALKLESVDISPVTYAATAPVVLSTDFGAASSTNSALRAPAGKVDERRVIVAGANLSGSGKSTVSYSDRSGNVVPTAPVLVDEVGYDASGARAFVWTFGDPNPADAQTAFDFEVQRVSDSVNVVTSGKTASTASTRTVAANALANGVAYRWRTRGYDELDMVGTWSAYDAFTTSALGTLTITSPATDNPAGLELASVPIAWTFSQADGYVQTQRRVKVVRVTDSWTVSDTGMTASTATSYTVGPLESDVQVRVELSIVTNAPGTPTVTALRLLTPSYSQPMTPTATLSVGESYVVIVALNPAPTGSRPDVVRNDVARRDTGSSGDFLVVGSMAKNGAYLDHAVASGGRYDYQVIGVAE